MIRRFFSIAWVSFLETVRQPIYGVLLVVTTLLLIFNVSLAGYTLQDDDKLLVELGLSTLLMSGLFLSSFSATGVLSREIENKTVLIVISKPVGRPMFYVAKFLGLVGALVLAHYLATLVFLLAQRHGVLQTTATPWDAPVLVFGFGSVILALLIAAFLNYFHGMDFPLTALALVTPMLTAATLLVNFFGRKWQVVPFGSDFPAGQVVIGAVLVLFFNVMVAAVAIAASTRLGQLMTLVTCVLFVCLAVVSDYAFGQWASQSTLAKVLYHLTPNLGPFWIIEGLMSQAEEMKVPLTYLLQAAAYAGLITLGLVSLGVALFQRREVG